MWAIPQPLIYAPIGMTNLDWIIGYFSHSPYARGVDGQGGPQPLDRYSPLGLQLLDIARAPDGLPERVVAGAWQAIVFLCDSNPPAAVPLFEAGLVEVAMATLRPFSPLERISKRQLLPSALLQALGQVVEQTTGAGVDTTPALLENGVVDMAISILTAYQLMDPEEVSVIGAWCENQNPILSRLDSRPTAKNGQFTKTRSQQSQGNSKKRCGFACRYAGVGCLERVLDGE
jgi:hypothetical protein